MVWWLRCLARVLQQKDNIPWQLRRFYWLALQVPNLPALVVLAEYRVNQKFLP